MIGFGTAYRVAALSAAVALAGCASPSPQACMLMGACASQTDSVRVARAPTKSLATVCFDGLHVSGSIPLSIAKAATGGASATINEGVRKSAQESARTTLEVYRKEAPDAVVGMLKAAGVTSTMCDGASSADGGRLIASIAAIKQDTGGLGWKSQLVINASLRVGDGPSTPVWSAAFTTGNKTAVGMAPDRANVEAFAENLIDEVGRSGWIARR